MFLATLEQCIQILRVEQDIATVQQKMETTVAKMIAKVGESENVEEKLAELQKAIDSTRLSRERLRGERNQLESRVGKCRTDLEDPNLRNIQAKYEDLLIEKTTLMSTVQELGFSYKDKVSNRQSSFQM